MNKRVRDLQKSAIEGEVMRVLDVDGKPIGLFIRKGGSVVFGSSQIDIPCRAFNLRIARQVMGKIMSLPLGSDERRKWYKSARMILAD